MEAENQAKVLRMLDVLSIEIGAQRNEMRAGFGRVERRLGNLETRVEGVEANVEVVMSELRSFRGEFERRIAPLER